LLALLTTEGGSAAGAADNRSAGVGSRPDGARPPQEPQEPKTPCDEIGQDDLGRPWPRHRQHDALREGIERRIAGRNDVPLTVADLMRAAYALGDGGLEAGFYEVLKAIYDEGDCGHICDQAKAAPKRKTLMTDDHVLLRADVHRVIADVLADETDLDVATDRIADRLAVLAIAWPTRSPNPPRERTRMSRKRPRPMSTEFPSAGLQGDYRDSSVICLRGTDTAIGVDGEAEWHIALLMELGIDETEAEKMLASATHCEPGMVPSGRFRGPIRVCADCAARSSIPRLVPALYAEGAPIPHLIQP
jgi:hypothetical protein